MDIAGESRYDNPALAEGENLVEGVSHKTFREGEALPLNVGGVRKKGEDPFLAIT
jgi:hypothetical protein